MESRMEKYYKEDLSTFERSKRNEKLYKEVYKEISDLDNLPIPDNSNEIDMDGLKQIISSRDEYRKSKELERTLITRRPLVEEPKVYKQDKIYDINVLLENAKNEVNRNSEVTSKKITTNFLASLEEANIPNSDDAIEVSIPMIEEKEKTSNTNSLPLDILMDLKGSDNTVVTDPIVKDEVTMIKKIKEGETFYSGSFNFSKKDFDEASEEDFLIENNHTGLKVFFLIIGILILIGAVYLILTKYVL